MQNDKKSLKALKKCNIKKFRLIGNICVFYTVEKRLVAGFIPTLIGVSECGKFKTSARIGDLIEIK